jgi:DNA-binding NarL/FixJ family response regulator
VSAPIRVLIADDHRLFRAGIRSLLDTVPDIAFVGEAENGHEALRMVAAHRPDVVLMDIFMPQLNGLDAAAQLVRSFPDVRIVILSMSADRDSVRVALGAGAVGYLVKTANPAELEQAIRAAARGERFLSAAIPDHATVLAAGQEVAKPLERLSPREREVLRLVVDGYSSIEISGMLEVSSKTVDTYRIRIRQKLGIDRLSDLIKFAIKEGLTTPD